MAIKITRPQGTEDITPKQIYKWHTVERMARETAESFGFHEMRIPTFESTDLFLRSVGETTDVVQKEMYTVKAKETEFTLRPEGTAGSIRSMLQNGLLNDALPQKIFYILSCFRHERPQAGRLREFHQFGVEMAGSAGPASDAEIIALAKAILDRAGLKNIALNINSIGCPQCRGAYQAALKECLAGKLDSLCKTCNERFERNPLRILDCKEDAHKLTDAPEMLDYLCEDCRAHFAALREYLDALGVAYSVDPRIVRGLDYYTKTVFEIVTPTEDGELTVCGGGRYDGLIEQLGGPATPGVGFGMGVERMLLVQQMQGASEEEAPLYDVFVATMGQAARLEGMKLVRELRENGLRADIDHACRSMKAQFKYAGKAGAKNVVVIGGDELEKGVVKLRDMENSVEAEVARDKIIEILLEMKGE